MSAQQTRCLLDHILVLIRGQDRTMAVPLSQLGAVDPMNRPPEPSPADITGWRWLTASELRTATESSPFSQVTFCSERRSHVHDELTP
jgi:hypothetical protein